MLPAITHNRCPRDPWPEDPMANLDHEDEFTIFNRFISSRGLKSTRQREIILQTFLETDKHIDIEELYSRVKDRSPSIGHATVYRTMKLLTECGLAHERHFGDGMARYEQVSRKKHHDHLICIKCGKIIEFTNSAIEKLQEKVAAQNSFIIFDHKLELYGHCETCRGS
jgi:Fur family ferric uptake transcriptional regulator